MQENQFLLGFAGTTVVVVITTVVLMLWMHNAFSKERELSRQVGRQLPGITPGTTLESKIKDCYINKGGMDLEELLKHTRPGGLLALSSPAGHSCTLVCTCPCQPYPQLYDGTQLRHEVLGQVGTAGTTGLSAPAMPITDGSERCGGRISLIVSGGCRCSDLKARHRRHQSCLQILYSILLCCCCCCCYWL